MSRRQVRPRTDGHRVAPIGEAYRVMLRTLMVRHGVGKTAILLRSSPETLHGASTGAAFMAGTRNRLELAIAKLDKDDAQARAAGARA